LTVSSHKYVVVPSIRRLGNSLAISTNICSHHAEPSAHVAVTTPRATYSSIRSEVGPKTTRVCSYYQQDVESDSQDAKRGTWWCLAAGWSVFYNGVRDRRFMSQKNNLSHPRNPRLQWFLQCNLRRPLHRSDLANPRHRHEKNGINFLLIYV
jgi:hypothetical protein